MALGLGAAPEPAVGGRDGGQVRVELEQPPHVEVGGGPEAGLFPCHPETGQPRQRLGVLPPLRAPPELGRVPTDQRRREPLGDPRLHRPE